MTFALYDPLPNINAYTTFYFGAIQAYAAHNGKTVTPISKLEDVRNCTLFTPTDYLTDETIQMLKNNGVRIVGFNVTDSSYISGACRYAVSLSMVDLIFMLSGVQTKNEGFEMVVKPDFTIGLEKRQFLVESAWQVFDYMRKAGRLQSLPYVHWEKQLPMEGRPYNLRSQKVLIRGGHHMRRFLLALKLMQHDLLDCNSGFHPAPYFADSMTHQFRYCAECRRIFKQHGYYPHTAANAGTHCENPMWQDGVADLSEPGLWNNRCPRSFFTVAEKFGADMAAVERLMNGQWLGQKEHLGLLACITFTGDLKWLFSVYAAQRFWDAASVGCINFLPERTNDQEYFPEMTEANHYLTFSERLDYLKNETHISEELYNQVSSNAKSLYELWIKPTEFAINTDLLKRIFKTTELLCNP